MNKYIYYQIIREADDADMDWEENAIQMITVTAQKCLYFLNELRAVSDEQHRFGVSEAIETIEREFGITSPRRDEW